MSEINIQSALKLQIEGKLDAAGTMYNKILQNDPKNTDALYNLGHVKLTYKKYDEAIELFRAALELSPQFEIYWLGYIESLIEGSKVEIADKIIKRAKEIGVNNNLLTLLDNKLTKAVQKKNELIKQSIDFYNKKRYIESIEIIQVLVKNKSQDPLVWKIYGANLKELNKIKEAIIANKKVLELNENDVEAYNNLAVTLKLDKQYLEAEKYFKQAIERNPKNYVPYYNLAGLYKEINLIKEAIRNYNLSISINNKHADSYYNLAIINNELNKKNEAKINYLKAIEEDKNHFKALNNLANIEKSEGNINAAIINYEKALRINENYVDALNNLGVMYTLTDEKIKSVNLLERALILSPDNSEIHNNLGNAYKKNNQIIKSIIEYKKSITLNKNFAEGYSNLATAQFEIGEIEEAKINYKKSLEINKNSSATFSNLLFCINHDENINQDEKFKLHLDYAKIHEHRFKDHRKKYKNKLVVNRQLKIGFVSGDFRNHAVTNFIEPVLKNLYIEKELKLYGFYNYPLEDSGTHTLKKYFHEWRNIINLNDEELYDEILQNEIDILIDLAGHTAHNRLATFARKPAPIQISWIGYPGTTGLQAIDYYLSDKWCLPHEKFDKYFTEKIVHLSASAIFRPFIDSPNIETLPAKKNNCITFGSFNRTNKINRSVVALWAEMLKLITNSKLIIAGINEEKDKIKIENWFQEYGLNKSRISFIYKTNIKEYLEIHNLVDIALDTFPYNGGTTTWHALWMGVPTITLIGGTMASRQGASILGQMGFEDFIANGKENYLEIGKKWSNNIEELSHIRNNMRDRFSKSISGKPELLADELKNLFKEFWNQWCLKEKENEKKNPNHDNKKEGDNIKNEKLLIQEVMKLYSEHQFKDAKLLIEKILNKNQKNQTGWKVYGAILKNLGNSTQAIVANKKAVELNGEDAEAINNLAATLQDSGELEEALEYYKLALKIGENPITYYNIAKNYEYRNNFKIAIEYYRKALKLNAKMYECKYNLANLLCKVEENIEAYELYTELLNHTSRNEEKLLINIANIDMVRGELNQAIQKYNDAMIINSNNASTYSNYLFCCSHKEDLKPEQIFQLHLEYAEKFEKPLKKQWRSYENSKNKYKKLNIGFVSGDFRNHAVANFIEPILSALFKDGNFKLYGYYNYKFHDEGTTKIKKLFHYWHDIYFLNDIELYNKIVSDQIDILFDLSGHTAYNRLLTFARKPAPVQISWIGYPATTGLSSIDYYITDINCAPPMLLDNQFTEKLLYLNSSAIFIPITKTPEVNELPALTNGYITFGSFNRPNKINRGVVDLWSLVLLNIPTAKLMIGGLIEESNSLKLIMWFKENGISKERLIFKYKTTLYEYLNFHKEIDMILDTFPYNGGTTTWYGLWMGIPTLTIAGDTLTSRQGTSIMMQTQLEKFIARDKKEFLSLAIYWNNNIKELHVIRINLRNKIQKLEVHDGKNIHKDFQNLLLNVWLKWCEKI